ncbi:MAG TPA: hypothetical protein VKB88_45080 [Bryobacteraceae bacterium]|nr:hypothetical protein [Bryobacteraceae bacterium]
MKATSAGASHLSGIIERGLGYLEEEQLPSGELPNFRLLANGSWEYCFSLLPTAYVHDALACFDPLSIWFDNQAVDRVNAASRASFVRRVVRIRRRALRFLAWQQSADLSWRFHGLGSALAPDPDLTAVAATALVDVRGRDRMFDWSLQTARIHALQCPDGLYGDGGARGEIAPLSIDALRLVASAHVLRYYALTGGDSEPLERLLEDRVSREECRTDFLWALVRSCRHGHPHRLARVHENIVRQLLARQDSNGSFGGPLTSALAMQALLDLEYEGPEIRSGGDALIQRLDPVQGRRYEGFGHDGCGSSAWTTIAIIKALARLQTLP